MAYIEVSCKPDQVFVTPWTAFRRWSLLNLRLLLWPPALSLRQPRSRAIRADRLHASTEYFINETIWLFECESRVYSSFYFQMNWIKSFLAIGVIWIVITGTHIVHARRREWVSLILTLNTFSAFLGSSFEFSWHVKLKRFRVFKLQSLNVCVESTIFRRSTFSEDYSSLDLHNSASRLNSEGMFCLWWLKKIQAFLPKLAKKFLGWFSYKFSGIWLAWWFYSLTCKTGKLKWTSI